MRKRRPEVEDNGNERWLITYADLITVLMIFFILMYAMSNVEKSKAQALIDSLYNAFNHVSVIDTQSGGSQPTNQIALAPQTINELQRAGAGGAEIEEERLQQLREKLEAYINDHELNTVIDLNDTPQGIQLSLKDLILFDSAQSVLKTNFLPTLDDIIGLVSSVDNPIRIEGHTDNRPINTARFPSNWELSGSRAISVLRYFEQQGIESSRLQFAGYGEYQPVYPNDTPENREANRRVNIIILRNQ